MLIPLGYKILVEPDKVKDIVKNGIVIPSTSTSLRPSTGTVIQVSKNKKLPLVKIGDKVLFKRTAGECIKFEGRTFLIMDWVDVLGITNPEGNHHRDRDILIDDSDIFQVIHDKIIVSIKYGSEIYQGKLVIPDNFDRVVSLSIIVAISQEVSLDWGFEIGQHLYCDVLSGHDVKIGNTRYKIISPGNVLGAE